MLTMLAQPVLDWPEEHERTVSNRVDEAGTKIWITWSWMGRRATEADLCPRHPLLSQCFSPLGQVFTAVLMLSATNCF